MVWAPLGNLPILFTPPPKVNFGDDSNRGFLIGHQDFISLSGSLGLATNLSAGVESPATIFGIVIDLNDLVHVVLNVDGLYRAPHCYELVWQINLDLHVGPRQKLVTPNTSRHSRLKHGR